MFSTLPSTPILMASTGMSSSTQRAWSATQSESIASTPSTPAVSCTVSAVTTEGGWQPMLASVSRSACSPAPLVGSDAANVRTIGGNADCGSLMAEMHSADALEATFARGIATISDSTPPPSILGQPPEGAPLDRHDEKIHVLDLRVDLRRGARFARRRPCAGNEMGGRAAELDVSGVRRAQGRLRDDRDLEDPMRILHTMLRVGDLQRSIDFYTNVMRMRVLRTIDRAAQKYKLAFVGYGDESQQAVL